jgi:16S rRNA (guanine527-N7)-methyltransferase
LTDLFAVLSEARERGYLGDQPIEAQAAQAEGFLEVARAVLGLGSFSAEIFRTMTAPGDAPGGIGLLDLGSGGGMPGLVLAANPMPFMSRFTLLEASERRAAWLAKAAAVLGISEWVEVARDRAELAGRRPTYRAQYEIVVSRSFGRPGVTAECAAPFLRPGGVLVVSEPPPDSPDLVNQPMPRSSQPLCRRWPSEQLAELGLGPPVERRANGYRYAAMRMTRECPQRYPRRNGVPVKHPLF